MKKLKIAMITLAFAGLASMSAYAGAWAKNAQGWWYDNGNGTWPASTWQWIDGNGDGVAECYYFDQYGYCLMNAVAPDGYTVDANGAWIINGVVQRKNVGAVATSTVTNIQQNNVKEADISEVELVHEWAWNHFDSEETASGSIWNDGYLLVDNGHAEFKLDKKYNKLSMTAIAGWINSTFAQAGDEYTLSFIGDNDEVLASYNLLDNIKKSKNIEVNVSGQEYVTIRWSSERLGNYYALMKNIKLK